MAHADSLTHSQPPAQRNTALRQWGGGGKIVNRFGTQASENIHDMLVTHSNLILPSSG